MFDCTSDCHIFYIDANLDSNSWRNVHIILDFIDLTDEPSDEDGSETTGDDDSSVSSDEEADNMSAHELEREKYDRDNDAEYCEWEDKLMAKKRTIYVFRNETKLEGAINAKKPIPGIVTLDCADDGTRIHQMYVVIRVPSRSFALRKINFDDDEGVTFFGLHFADIEFGEIESEGCPQSMEGIQQKAQMAALAIPLWYVLGEEHEDANKYCVITNWWKERQSDGTYALPKLDLKQLYN